MNIDEMVAGRGLVMLVASALGLLKKHKWSDTGIGGFLNTPSSGSCRYCGRWFNMPFMPDEWCDGWAVQPQDVIVRIL